MPLIKNATPLSIVLLGHDERLVQTRRWILEKEGYRVFTPTDPRELSRMAAEEHISLFLLCDSLSLEVRQHSLSIMRSRWPRAKRLVLMPSGGPTELDRTEEVFPAMDGPRKLVAKVRRLVVNGSQAAS